MSLKHIKLGPASGPLHLQCPLQRAQFLIISVCFTPSCLSYFFLNKKFYWRKIEPPRTQGKEHENSSDTELKVTTTQCCLRLLFNFLSGFHQFFK